VTNEPRAHPSLATAGRPVTLVDSSVVLDIVTEDPAWAEWSAEALAQARDDGLLVINPIVYAEVSTGFDRIEDLDDAVPADDFRREALPYEAAFVAGKAFLAYRRRGGQKRAPLPDFYIGAHAAVRGYRLLTRDAARYRTYFPTVTLIAPDC
jgi:predicted nucleic acid-binding protein